MPRALVHIWILIITFILIWFLILIILITILNMNALCGRSFSWGQRAAMRRGTVAHCSDSEMSTRLWAWELEEHHRVVLLDSDLLARTNVDEAFAWTRTTYPIEYGRGDVVVGARHWTI